MTSDANQVPDSEPQPPSPADSPQTESQGPQASPPAKPRILIGSQRDPGAYGHRPRRDWISTHRKRPRRGRAEEGDQTGPEAPPAAPDAVQTPPSVEPIRSQPVEVVPTPPSVEAPGPVSPPPAPPTPVPVIAESVTPPQAVVSPPSPAPTPPPAPPAAETPVMASEAEISVPESVAELDRPVLAATPAEAAPAEAAALPTDAPPDRVAPVRPDRDDRRGGPRRERERRRAQAEEDWTPPPKKLPVPNLRARLSADLAQEFEEAIGGASIEDLLAEHDALTPKPALELESRQKGRVVHVHRDDVFVELGGREQGIVPLRQFPEPPQAGTEIEVVVNRFNAEDGLYELSLPAMAADVEDWSDLSEGIMVEARVTGHNAGGLECEVHHIRGFIPVSQIALYRVSDMAEFVGQKLACLVTECNPQRGNLVLSRRALLEREREAARQATLESLEPGQIREGVVRKIMDFGAFVDLGSGVDGLLHVSRLSWARVEHPSEIVKEGQAVQVKVEKVDKATGRISLSYREMQENPWTRAAERYPQGAMVRGKVRKLMEFGAFVEVEPGVEGLVHISELSHKRVWRTSDVVKEGDEVEVVVLSVDAEAQRMSLSIRQALPAPEKTKKEEEAEPAEAAPPPKKQPPKRSEPLRGGLGGPSGGDRFGLKW